MAHREPGDPREQAQELDEPDHRLGSPVDRGPPDRRGERVGVVDLGELLARDVSHYDQDLSVFADLGRHQGRQELAFLPPRPAYAALSCAAEPPRPPRMARTPVALS